MMKQRFILIALIFSFFNQNSWAQNSTQAEIFPIAVLIIIGALILAVVFVLINNFLLVAARKKGVVNTPSSSFLGLNALLKKKLPSYIPEGDQVFRLNKGHDILLTGKADPNQVDEVHPSRVAVQPPNFRGIAPIPKLMVKEGEEVLAGDPLFFNKNTSEIKYVAPVSGEIVAVNRGSKRAITEVVILADKQVKYTELPELNLDQCSREELVSFLATNGFWPLIIQRPYGIVPELDCIPENIFISTFDSAPLAPDYNLIVEGKEDALYQGLQVLSKLTAGKVYLGLNATSANPPASAFLNAPAEKVWFEGAHPAGNVGVQIHHISPIGNGQKVWTLGLQETIILGKMFKERKFDTSKMIAVGGSGIKNPGYLKTYAGAHIGDLLKDQLKDGNYRIISGDVLTGKSKTTEQFTDIHTDLITVIEEGDYYDMFGWLFRGKFQPSISGTYLNKLYKKHRFDGDTNTHGEKRAFVMTGQYEKVLPMDIYPQHLMKAILANDFEKMEGLGIYELQEEDVALCEFACTSKMPLQKILRQGLETMREQG